MKGFSRIFRTAPVISSFLSPVSLRMSSSNVPRIDSVQDVASTKWLALKTLTWTDQEGTQRKWDLATRTTKKSVDSSDAVVIIPLLRSPDGSVDTLLVEQYRPPVRQSTTEFPAGLIDDNETPEQAALRELREETGYVGEACKTPPHVSRPVCMTPGLSDETVQVVMVEVDLSNPYNQNPKPDLDDGEHCVVKRVGLKEGMQTLLDQDSTPMPIMGLYLFALGYELGRQHAPIKK